MKTTIDEMTAPSVMEASFNSLNFGAPNSAILDMDPRDYCWPARGPNPLSPAQSFLQSIDSPALRLAAAPEVHSACVWLWESEAHSMPPLPLLGKPRVKLMETPLDGSIAEWIWNNKRQLIIKSRENTHFRQFAGQMLRDGINSFCALPLMINNQNIGVLGLASSNPEALDRLDAENNPEESDDLCAQTAPAEHTFQGIVGQSTPLKALRDDIKVVAPTNSTVLIQGETGTGKELIARAIHNLSSRRDRPIVRINCAAIPSGLLESEFFGHERGAFTGAVARKIGRFEAAHRGTLFLDEVGDIPLELQPKLLRVLQEQEFERLGSTQTTKVDVRIVAATSLDLRQMVSEKRFRGDLYYRLNVFPLRAPALKDRSEDIPLLVRHFVFQNAQRMNKTVKTIPAGAMDRMLQYSWPGNVRELQNFVERAVILSPGETLRAPLSELELTSDMQTAAVPTAKLANTTLHDAQRELIIQALVATNWVVGGPNGAGARLGLHRTTLISKMKKLGISRAQA
ncbi:MAG TPA: sigma 54-interacting transcriptional regulator [Verrucomicrobiae bacterium]|jgi:formate hydrogenlyase transcriptional activator